MFCKTPIFILLIFAHIIVCAQEGYELGYIITNKGDTIRGKIKDRKYTASPANSDKIRFIDSTGKEKGLDPYEIKQYYKKGVFFRTLPIGLEAKLKFAEVLEYERVRLSRC